MTTTTTAGAGLKKAIKGKKEERVHVSYLQAQLVHQQAKTPMDYREVIGLLASPFIGCSNVFTLENAVTDITDALIEVLSDKSSLQAAKSPTFTKSLGAVLTFLSRLSKITPIEGEDANDHIWTLANLWQVERWEQLTPEAKEHLLDMYGTDEVWRK